MMADCKASIGAQRKKRLTKAGILKKTKTLQEDFTKQTQGLSVSSNEVSVDTNSAFSTVNDVHNVSLLVNDPRHPHTIINKTNSHTETNEEVGMKESPWKQDDISNNTQTGNRQPENGSKLNTWFNRIRTSKRPPNILFIIADDMRPDIGAYHRLAGSHGNPWLNQAMYTPHLDRLAQQSLVFTQAYSQQAQCNPSRSSFLTSRRPDTTKVHNNSVSFRAKNPHFVTLPQYLKNKGYYTISAGKVFHQVSAGGATDEPNSWSEPCFHASTLASYRTDNKSAWTAVPDDDLKKSKLLDEIISDRVLEILDDLATTQSRQPFFLAMGLKKPHLPFEFPERFLEYYPPENVSMPLNPTAPVDMPDIAWFNSRPLRAKPGWSDLSPTWTAREAPPAGALRDLRRAYYATISYIDDLIGKVLSKLGSSGLSNDTVVLFLGDHGIHLGEQGIVGKKTVFGTAANAPLMIRVPGVTDQGMVSKQLVEFVDVYPTLVELVGLPPLPRCPRHDAHQVSLCTEGLSLTPLFESRSDGAVLWKESVFYQQKHTITGARNQTCMGYTIRTTQYRYTEWTPFDPDHSPHQKEDNHPLCGAELYDLIRDPHETTNRADDDSLRQIQEDLRSKLRDGWTGALPSNMKLYSNK